MTTPPPGLRRDEGLARHTSLKIGGPAAYFVAPRSADELVAALQWAEAAAVSVRVVGGGSNLLIADAGFDGLVVRPILSRWRVADRAGSPVLFAEAGVPFGTVARSLSKEGFGGLEWAATVPGTVAGAVVNNAGAFGSDTAASLLAAWLVDRQGVERCLLPGDLDYAYRTSRLKRRELGDVAVTRVELALARVSATDARERVAAFQAQRSSSQPRRLSAGSVFANPPGAFAGKLIEDVGLKGVREGDAQISSQHANFIVNLGRARADDVLTLIRCAQEAVLARFGVWLRPEIELFGAWSVQQQAALAAPATEASIRG